jgi:hypothetical protein
METRFGLATTLCTMSNVYEKKGDFEKAIDVMRRGMEMHKEAGDASGEAVACINLVGIFLQKANATFLRLSSLQCGREALKRSMEEYWHLHTESIATYSGPFPSANSG